MRAWLHARQRPVEIWGRLEKERTGAGMGGPSLTAVRKALTGKTHRKGGPETRGRKRKLSPRAVAAIDAKRKELISKADGAREVTWSEILRKARVKKVHASTARRALATSGVDVTARAPREKPQRTAEHRLERLETCRRWRYLPRNFFATKVDFD